MQLDLQLHQHVFWCPHNWLLSRSIMDAQDFHRKSDPGLWGVGVIPCMGTERPLLGNLPPVEDQNRSHHAFVRHCSWCWNRFAGSQPKFWNRFWRITTTRQTKISYLLSWIHLYSNHCVRHRLELIKCKADHISKGSKQNQALLCLQRILC